MTKKYIHNWYSLIPVYLNVMKSVNIKFKNGKSINVSRDDYMEFREELFQQYLTDKGFSFDTEENYTVVTTNNNLRLLLIKNYSNVVDEIFVRKIYGEEYFVGKTIIDAGASIGDTALYFVSNGATTVYGFEVDEERYKIAIRNVKMNYMDDKIIILNNEATGDSISKLIIEKELKNVVIKLDCEGCEFEIINNLSDSIFKDIDFIIMEYHSKPDPLISKLKELGYTIKKDKKMLIPEGFIFAKKKN